MKEMDCGSDEKAYEIKYEISAEDYKNNELNYTEESFYTALANYKYIEKKDDTTYTCIRRVSKIGNKELYKKISDLK